MAEKDLSVAHSEVKITLKKDGENITLEYAGESPPVTSGTITIGKEQTYKDIASALDSIGYIVTASDSYYLQWDFSGYEFPGNTKMEFILDTSLKDSLMYLAEEDQDYFYDYPDADKTILTLNKAGIDESTEYSAKTLDQYVKKDLEIRKSAYVGGKQLDESYQPKEKDVIDYFVKAMHYGSGSYEVLPVVDHMAGRQVAIVEVEKNKEATWKNDATLRAPR